MIDRHDIAARIAALRRRGLSLPALADALGLPQPQLGGRVTVARWQAGQVPRTHEKRDAISRRLAAVERIVLRTRNGHS